MTPDRADDADPTTGHDAGGLGPPHEPPAPIDGGGDATSDVTTAPPMAALIADSLGGWRGAVDSGLPSAVFLLAYLVTGQQLRPSLVVALIAAVLLAVTRLVRRQPVNQVVAGLVGVGICAFLAARTGRAEDFYLPGLLLNGAYALAMIGSVVVGHPLIGYVFGALTGDPTGWRSQPAVRRACTIATLLFAGTFLLRIAVQWPLYLAGAVGALGVARLAMGYPLYLAVAYLSYRIIARSRTRSPV